MKMKKLCSAVVATVLGGAMIYSVPAFAADSAKQLAKGIELYNKNKTSEAMDYFIDVMVNGTSAEIAEANRYVDRIHNQIGGIQSPVEVAADYAEGAVKQMNTTVNNTVSDAQARADALALQNQRLQQELAAREQAAAQNLATQKQNLEQDTQRMLNDLAAVPQQWDEDVTYAVQTLDQQAQQTVNNAATRANDIIANGTEEMTVAQLLGADVLTPTQAYEDVNALQTQTNEVLTAAQEESYPVYNQSVITTTTTTTSGDNSSVFADLTTPEAIEARAIYTDQKIASMTQAAIDRIASEPGVHLYLRDGRPDAIDIDDGVIFQGTNFRTESVPLLNSIYELLALTQGAEYIILPPGSYTDDVTLAGIREAMALNSYLVKRGISQGKLYYNLGLVDKEAPAQFANLKGLSIVFDYDSKLPTRLEKNADNETNPLLSMAIVPQCHAIDRSLGEAYAIDFSVLETTNGIDNWVLQVVQHGRDGNYYIVRQLEGFSPVYHRILWNGRKGIIGPELPCGKYTLVLTATDLQGNKQTLRRRVVVKCNSSQSDNITAFCGVKEPVAEKVTAVGALNYNATRLWKKPGRQMGGYVAKAKANANAAAAATSAEQASDSSTYTVTKTVTNIVTEDTSAPVTTAATTSSSSSYSSTTGGTTTSSYTETTTAGENPFGMPYEEDF